METSVQTTLEPSVKQSLHQLLDEGVKFDPVYLPSFNSDHLPMTLTAMANLGASSEILKTYQTRYQTRLRPVQASGDYSSLSEGRGQPDAFESNRQFLNREIEADTWQVVVRRHLPGLLPSLAVGAFHPFIRLGAAVSVGHKGEVASALAYWMTSRFNPRLSAPITGSSLSLILAQDEPIGVAPGAFGTGLLKVLELGYPVPVSTDLRHCAEAALDVYLGTRNFFALHLVTATQAARMCLPYVEEAQLIAALTAAIRAAYLVLGAPDFSISLPVPNKIDEEHGLKYVYACASEFEAWQDPRYLREIEDFKKSGLVPNWVLVKS
jgi:hypothetical protein